MNFYHLERKKKREGGVPEGLGEDEEAGEADGVGGIMEKEPGAVGKIGVGGGEGVVGEEAREVRGGHGVVEEIFAGDEIAGVEAEGCVYMERRPAQPHHPEG